MNPITSFLVAACLLLAVGAGCSSPSILAVPFIAAAVIIGLSLKMANAWEKFVILRMGKLQSVKGAGLFVIVPLIDNVVAIIDERIQTTAFNAEQALTRVRTCHQRRRNHLLARAQRRNGRARHHQLPPRPSIALRRPRCAR